MLRGNFINSSDVGTPCRIGEVVGRIVAHHESGSAGLTNDKEYWSIVLVSTPHGSVLKSGIAYLSEPNEDEFKKLKAYEDQAKELPDDKYYGGYLTKNHKPCQKN